MPSVSVVIPNYNHSLFLDQRIQSVLNQSFQDFELIILDDCSTDNSRSIIEKYRGQQQVAQIIYNDVNSGNTFKQWLKGIDLCRGEYIWIAESDDYADKHFLSLTVEALRSKNDASYTFVQSNWIDKFGTVFEQPKHPDIETEKIDDKAFIEKYMLCGNLIYNASAVLFRKKAYIDNKVRLDKLLINFRYCGDWLFWSVLLKNKSLVLIPSFQNYFRRLDFSVSEQGNKRVDSIFEIIEVIRKIKTLYKICPSLKLLSQMGNKISSSYRQTESSWLYTANILVKCAKIHVLLPLILSFKLARS
ncbi:glycosyltransferase family 2 protein [Pedobacter sp. AW1-32]|uniref:glycosyltransferase family 2 protein n=1 Tax=Pedobacter sp. AW1-32 TaxID=3383026 RepID=UPI003FED91D6